MKKSKLFYETQIDKKYFFVHFVIVIIPLIVNLIWILILGEYRSEFRKEIISVELTNLQIIACFFFNIVVWALLMTTFFCIQRYRFVIKRDINISFVRPRLEFFLIVIILVKFVFSLTTGIGKAASDVSGNPLSTLVNMMNSDLLFLIYYLSYREDLNRNFVFIVLIYIIDQVVRGWTSIFLTIAYLEIFVHLNDKRAIKYLLFLPLIFFIGAFVYKFLYPLKFFIRLGYFEQISYGDAIIKLFERLSWFSHSCVSFQNSDKIVNLYKEYGYSGTELKSFWKPILPSFLMNKDFRTINNLLMASVYPAYPKTTSANFGILGLACIIAKISFWDLFFYLVAIVVNTFFYKLFIDMVTPSESTYVSYAGNFILFRYFSTIFSNGCLEHISYGWVSIIWTYVFLYMIGTIKIRRFCYEKIINY